VNNKINPKNLANRRYVIAALVVVIGIIYVVQLFNLQLLSPQYRDYADSNAFLRRTLYPARGAIYDRKGELLVYNRPTYDVMMVVREMTRFDTLDFCNTLNIDIERFRELDAEMRDSRKNPGYSSYTPQLFMSQLDIEEYGLLQEKLYKFPGIYIQSRTERQYNHPNMGLILGYVAEVDQNKIASDPYYVRKDYVGKSGIELSHEIERLNAEFLASEKNYVLVGPGRWGSSDPWLGIPVKWPHISQAKIIVESGMENYRIEPSQGTHFFQNLTSFGVGYFTVNPFLENDGFFDVDFLNEQTAFFETDYIRHVRFDKPIVIKINGKKRMGVVMKP
jgi:hypothetical protein